jgi:hypothetical protein
MKLLIFLTFIYSFSVLADICICQYPKEDARYGGGYKGEIAFYKMGCQVWHLAEKKCRKKKTIDINESLSPYLDKHHRKGEKIRVSFVGHWSDSAELVSYLKNEIEPIREKYNSPIRIENTACSAMEDTNLVSKYLQTIDTTDKNYLEVEGSQVTSIGMWDKVSFAFRKADLVATSDSRNSSPIYPVCSEFLDRRCTGVQQGDKGYCVDDQNQRKELICHGRIKTKRNGSIKISNAERWLDIEVVKVKMRDYILQEELKLKGLMYRSGLEVPWSTSLMD